MKLNLTASVGALLMASFVFGPAAYAVTRQDALDAVADAQVEKDLAEGGRSAASAMKAVIEYGPSMFTLAQFVQERTGGVYSPTGQQVGQLAVSIYTYKDDGDGKFSHGDIKKSLADSNFNAATSLANGPTSATAWAWGVYQAKLSIGGPIYPHPDSSQSYINYYNVSYQDARERYTAALSDYTNAAMSYGYLLSIAISYGYIYIPGITTTGGTSSGTSTSTTTSTTTGGSGSSTGGSGSSTGGYGSTTGMSTTGGSTTP